MRKRCDSEDYINSSKEIRHPSFEILHNQKLKYYAPNVLIVRAGKTVNFSQRQANANKMKHKADTPETENINVMISVSQNWIGPHEY